MKNSDSGIVFYVRLVGASFLCWMTISFGLSVLAMYARTEDWVLEYRYWLMGGIYFLGAVVWIATMVLSRLRKPKEVKP
jgi:uncharacterized membrane protein YbhN (UPF0104 family)